MRQLVDAAGICCRLNIFSYSNIFAEMLPFLLFEFDVMSRVKIIKKIIIKIRKNKRNKEIKKGRRRSASFVKFTVLFLGIIKISSERWTYIVSLRKNPVVWFIIKSCWFTFYSTIVWADNELFLNLQLSLRKESSQGLEVTKLCSLQHTIINKLYLLYLQSQ